VIDTLLDTLLQSSRFVVAADDDQHLIGVHHGSDTNR
jgi:hypothetical protein